MKTKVLLSLILASAPLSQAQEIERLEKWLDSTTEDAITVHRNGTDYRVPVSKLTGTFSITFDNFEPRLILEPGFNGLGFVTTPQKTLKTSDSHLSLSVEKMFSQSLDPKTIFFLMENTSKTSAIVSLAEIYAYLKKETLEPTVEEGAKKALKLFFNDDQTLGVCCWHEVEGYRIHNTLSADAIFLVIVPQEKKS